MPWTSISSRISSATQTAGCVSLSWIATFSARLSKRPYCCMCRRRMSWSEAEEKKYSCRSRSSCPDGEASAGIEHPGQRVGAVALGRRRCGRRR